MLDGGGKMYRGHTRGSKGGKTDRYAELRTSNDECESHVIL